MANTIGILQVESDQLLSASSQLSQYVTTMNDCFGSIKSLMERTQNYWIGEAGDAHRLLYKEQVEKTEEIIRRYQEHVTDLNAMAGVYETAEKSNESAVDTLPASNL